MLLPQWRLGFAIGAAFTAARGGRGPRAGPVGLPAGAAAPDVRLDRSWRDLAALRRPALGALLLGVASAAVWTYGRAHLVAEGLSVTASVVAWIALGVGGTATVLTAGRQARLAPARAWALTSAAVAVSIAAPGPRAGLAAGVAPAACLVFGWAFVAATSALIAWASALVPGRAASGTAVLFVTLTLGQAVGSTAVGVTADHLGRPLAFLLAAAVGVLAAACGLGADKDAVRHGRADL